ncbi:MAG: exopolyphosphatase, partial [Pseudomonadota bacterium]
NGSRQGVLFADDLTSFAPLRAGDDRIGVIDVGSNSVRMVVFEGGRRCPAMVFNEKVLCGLGAELGKTGRLAPVGRERALRAIQRFMTLAQGLRVGSLVGVATAALREAEDGVAFGEQIREETRLNLQIISGEDEARLAAQGVLFGDPEASGLVIDLGGASMEICPIVNGEPLTGVTTRLGPQRLASANGDRTDMREMIDTALTPVAQDFAAHSHRLNLVGGAWRALGRVQLHLTGHPLTILHEYEISADEAHDLALWTAQADSEMLASMPGVPGGRVGTLPQAAFLLTALLDHFEPDDLKISGFGLRE